jgi:hypothetical protein
LSGLARIKWAALAATLTLLGGCTYDYLQRSDKVAYSAGDAVKANLERQTTNPTKGSSYSTKGLGKNGQVIETEAEAATPTP